LIIKNLIICLLKRHIKRFKWILNLRENGKNWKPDDPEIIEMYPNCCNSYDDPWTELKNDVAYGIGELTQIWNVSVKHREIAFSNGISSIYNDRLNSEMLGIKNIEKAQIIDKIININRSDNDELYTKPPYKNPLFRYSLNEYYVDFETINF
jgi:hypothetical protein